MTPEERDARVLQLADLGEQIDTLAAEVATHCPGPIQGTAAHELARLRRIEADLRADLAVRDRVAELLAAPDQLEAVRLDAWTVRGVVAVPAAGWPGLPDQPLEEAVIAALDAIAADAARRQPRPRLTYTARRR